MIYCPVCHSDTKVLFIKNSYPIRGCISCKHRFAEMIPAPEHVTKYYSDDYFFGGNAGYPDYMTEKYNLIKRGKYYNKILSKYIKDGQVLDVGAAAGFILKAFIEQGWEGKGVEPNRKMVNYAKEVMGLDMANSPLEEYELKGEVYDLVICIQVIGHVYNINRVMKKIHDALRPGGFLLIETWNSKSIIAKLLNKSWHVYSPPTVLNYFSRKTLDMFVTSYGFKKIQSRITIKKISGIHAKSLLKYKYVNNPAGILSGIIDLIPDKVFLPYIFDDLFWALYQKNDGPVAETIFIDKNG